MAISLRKLIATFTTRGVGQSISKTAWFRRLCSSYSSSLGPRFCLGYRQISESTFDQVGPRATSANIEDDAGMDYMEFKKWHNGGGFFHKSACIDSTTVIEIGAVVHPKSVLGVHVHVGSGAIIGPAVIIGQQTRIGYNAVLSNCSIGESCIIHSGVCVGQDGFGFFIDELGNMSKKPQIAALLPFGKYDQRRGHSLVHYGEFFELNLNLMREYMIKYEPFQIAALLPFGKYLMLNAKIGNHVEIGSNTCIDRGSWRDTIIGDHSKIDNLVQIGHNVVIGKHCMLCGQVGLAGSVTLGDYVTLGGRVAVRDHVNIASKVRLAANSCVTKDISVSGDYGGFPAVPIHEWRRQVATHRRIVKKGIS